MESIDLTNIMYVKDYSSELVDCMIMLVKETLGTDLGHISKVIVPCRGNRMIGFGVGEKLGKAIINVTQYARVFEDQCWEGNFDSCLTLAKTEIVFSSLHSQLT